MLQFRVVPLESEERGANAFGAPGCCVLLLEPCSPRLLFGGVLLARPVGASSHKYWSLSGTHACSRARNTGRLYVKGVMMGFKRGLRNQHENTAILKVHNVADAESTQFYVGKRVCYIYK